MISDTFLSLRGAFSLRRCVERDSSLTLRNRLRNPSFCLCEEPKATKQSLSAVLTFDWAGFSFTARLPRPDLSGLAMTRDEGLRMTFSPHHCEARKCRSNLVKGNPKSQVPILKQYRNSKINMTIQSERM